MTALVLALGLVATAASAQEATRPAKASTASASAGAPVNLNTATVAQLEALPGIGKSTAERILEYRQKNGSFKKIEDLMNVRGIGEKSFLKMKGLITVTAPKS
ncbi:MAG TPA: helix-hairpin-helix domain-containing protein [Vicinamibacterales bacterium]|nr:helix-hairpin-helix domain-containing protein [Vicinamibacterales bacterium]